MVADAPRVPNVLTEAPLALAQTGLEFYGRRMGALADFWGRCVGVRQPAELAALEFDYWTHMVEDYQKALAAGMNCVVGSPTKAGVSFPGAGG